AACRPRAGGGGGVEDGGLHRPGDRRQAGLRHPHRRAQVAADPLPVVGGGPMSSPAASTPPVEVARHVDQVCTRFEAAWKAGERPRVEDYLPEGPQAERSALAAELIPLEAEYRRRLGEDPGAEEYQGRFPALDRAWLAQALAAPG